MIVAAVLFCVCSCPVHALDVVDSLDGVLVVVNNGRPVPAYDGVVSADQLSSANSLTVSSIDFYVPFEAPSNTVVVRLSLLCASSNLSVTGDVQAGAYSGGVFYPHYTLPYSQWDYGYSAVDGVALTNTGYSVDTSSVPASDFAWFVHFRLSGDAILNLSQGSISGSTTGSIEGALGNGRGTFSSTSGSFGADLFATDNSTPLWQYYDSYHTIYWKSAGARFAYLKSTSLSLAGDLSISAGLYGVIRTTFERTSLADYPPIRLTATRTDDDAEAVSELQKANTTLTKISADMDKLVNHQQEVDDTADNIGGTTSDGTISNTSTDFNSGTGTVDDFSTEATSHSQSLLHLTSGFSDLMTMATPVLLNFGPSGGIGPLHIALLIVIAVFGVTFFIRRLL